MPPLTSSRREVSGPMTQGKAKFTHTSTTTQTATGITSAGATRPLPQQPVLFLKLFGIGLAPNFIYVPANMQSKLFS